MNPDSFKNINMSYTIVPTVRNGKYIVKDNNYKFAQYIEEGRPTLPETTEPENMDCSDALAVIAGIKSKL